MRKQIAAANWKMNLSLDEAKDLAKKIIETDHSLSENQLAIFAVPFVYISSVQELLNGKNNVFVAAQNCSKNKNGAYTGEISASMLASMGIKYVIIGHSERREYQKEDSQELSEKVNIALENSVKPIFCCGESLKTREAGDQNSLVEQQLKESLFHLSADQVKNFIVAYEPIWAIGTGKTASSNEAQEMHAHIRSVFQNKYGKETADTISILYGGSVKAANAADIFGKPDVDGGLVGGASLDANEFSSIISSLKK